MITDNNKIPLCVDLDGTLIKTDMLHESTLAVFKINPFFIFIFPFILILKGKAALKRWIAVRFTFESKSLPYNLELVKFLRAEHGKGRQLILCTASDYSIAKAVASNLGIFSEVMASDGLVNLEGKMKAKALVTRFGEKGFDYAGNSRSDLEIWRHARKAIVAGASVGLLKDAGDLCTIDKVFKPSHTRLTIWAKCLRLHQWLKNCLLFVPLLAAHQLNDGYAWLSLLFAFVSFSLCASSVYISNDLLDLENDRQHPRKCNRPFASGALPVYKGALLAPILFLLSCGVGYYVGPDFLQWLLIYFVLTCIYSVKLKQLVLVDCMTLAILYTLRIVAGAAGVGSAMSFWLLAFSVFLFLSLAFIKRFAELQVQLLQGKQKAHGRGYFTDDAPLIQMLGIASGFMSVLVLALYLNSPEVQLLYIQPAWVWGNVPVMVFWVSWLWLRAQRGEMHDDPLIFAVKDKVSLVSGVLFAGFLILGSLHT
jgi:4-hydroxybenzoate polyprenyltransferase